MVECNTHDKLEGRILPEIYTSRCSVSLFPKNIREEVELFQNASRGLAVSVPLCHAFVRERDNVRALRITDYETFAVIYLCKYFL